MVDADQQGPDDFSGPEDLAFVGAPPRERRLKRTNTAPKKPEPGGLMGLIGSLRRTARPDIPERPTPERRKSRSHRDDDARYMTEPERDEARRLRKEEKRRRSIRPNVDGDGFVTDAGPPGAFPADPEAEEAEARRAARRAKRASRQVDTEQLRDRELQEAEERRARRRERQRAREREMQERQLREEQEQQEQLEKRREEKQARRAAREARRATEEQEAREAEARAEAKAAERRERRRLREADRQREMEMYENEPRSKRYSRIDDRTARDFYLGDQDVDRSYRHRSVDERDKSRRRKSRIAPEPPMMTGGRKDKISNWVDSQATDPPEPPPIVPTVLDVPPNSGEQANVHSMSSDEEARRELRRKSRRRARYPGMTDEEIDEMRARKREGMKSSSGSGDYDRDRGARYDRYDRYAPPPNTGGKMPNWFKKLTSF